MASVLNPSMFAYLIWQNKEGKELKAMFQVEKAIKIADDMTKLGVESKIIIAQPLSYIK